MIEFLRYLYTREVELNEDLAMKLIKLADKYVQNDLSEKCLDFLKLTINSENVYKRFDFAFKQNLDELKDFCKNFLKNNLDTNSLPGLIQSLEKLPEVKPSVVTFIVNNFDKVYEKYSKNWPFYEDFLIENVDMSTILLFVNLIYGEHSEDEIMQKTHSLHKACFDFAGRNLKEIHQKGLAYELPKKFLVDLALSAMGQLSNIE